jgi:Ni/Co efflux regulator RcnB
MRTLPIIVTLILGIALAAPAAPAELRISTRIGSGGGSAVMPRHAAPWAKRRVKRHTVRRHAERRPKFRLSARVGSGGGVKVTQHVGEFWAKRRAKRRAERRHRRSLRFYPNLYGYRYGRERAPAPVEPRPVPDPPVVVAPAEPPPPPDPHGPLRLTTARGIAPAEAPYSLGEALPPDLPHVTLSWRQFDLPEPPAGQLYARVGRDVLLITATGRIVESVLPPG